MRYALGLFAAAVIAAHASAVPPDLVTSVGTEFVKDGQAYRFIGVNLRGLVHYGGGDGALPYTNIGHIDENLAGAQNMGCRVVRVFAANQNISHQTAVNRLGYALDKADQYGIKLIIALTDFYPTPFHPQGDDGYYAQNPGGYTVLTHDWFATGYQNNYLPYVQLAVSTYKDHPAVFSWQLGNEIADQTNATTHDAFVHTMAASIRAIDPYHMISIGMLSLAHIPGYTAQRGITLFSDPNLSFITGHRYNSEDWTIDFDVRNAVMKPIVMSEAGCKASVVGDRVAFMDGLVDLFVHTRGARGFMNWGYQAQAWDIGDGDNVFGVDRYAHPDYNAMFSMYQGHAATLNGYTATVEPVELPQGRNLARTSAAWLTDSIFGLSYTGAKAIDGLLSTKWCSTNATSTHWLSLDLGGNKWITGYKVQHAGAGGEESYYNGEHYLIQTGPSFGGPWTTRFDVDNTIQLNWTASVHHPPLSARYVRLYLDNCGIDNYARLPEFEVYGGNTLAELSPRGDFDADHDADLADFVWMQRCFSGAGNPHPGTVGSFDCARANLERGTDDPPAGDVDLADYAAFTGCFAGPDAVSPLDCY